MKESLRQILRRHAGSLAERLATELATRSGTRYQKLDHSVLSLRCHKLVEALIRSALESPEHLGEYVGRVADCRLGEGFELEELQRALRLLEVHAWRVVAAESSPDSLRSNLASLNTAMGFARDELARAGQARAYAIAASRPAVAPERGNASTRG